MIWNGPMGVFEYEAFAKVRGATKLHVLLPAQGLFLVLCVLPTFSSLAEKTLGCESLEIMT